MVASSSEMGLNMKNISKLVSLQILSLLLRPMLANAEVLNNATNSGIAENDSNSMTAKLLSNFNPNFVEQNPLAKGMEHTKSGKNS